MGASSEVLAYYEIRLSDTSGELIIRLDGEITIKTIKSAMIKSMAF